MKGISSGVTQTTLSRAALWTTPAPYTQRLFPILGMHPTNGRRPKTACDVPGEAGAPGLFTIRVVCMALDVMPSQCVPIRHATASSPARSIPARPKAGSSVFAARKSSPHSALNISTPAVCSGAATPAILASVSVTAMP